MYRLTGFYYSIKNLFTFFKSVWRFRGYDYECLFPILQVCLTRFKLDCEVEELESIQYCLDILERLQTPFIYDDMAESEVGFENPMERYRRANELEDFEYNELFDTMKNNLTSWWV